MAATGIDITATTWVLGGTDVDSSFVWSSGTSSEKATWEVANSLVQFCGDSVTLFGTNVASFT